MEEHLVELLNVCKSFPGVKALDNVSFNVRPGEVMALLGENGAGKSTLIKIIGGVHNLDSGELRVYGKKVEDMSPKKAQELGIAVIHQELNLCPHLTVAENMFLGRELCFRGFLRNREMYAKAQEALSSLGLDISPDTIVGSLPVSKQSMIEIAKAISIDARVFVMDEPTSALTSKEIDELFTIIKRLRADGHAIIYISHRLEELKHIADRVTILRDGQFVDTGDFADYTMSDIIRKMVGRKIEDQFPRVKTKRGKKIFEVRGLNAGRLVRNVNIDLYEGEIVGIAGLMGAGRTEATRAIFGVDHKTSGEITIGGKRVRIKKPSDAIKAGLVLVPEDRKKDGLCTRLSIRENIALPNLDWICSKLGIVKKSQENEIVQKSREQLMIKISSMENNAASLSGGNQQKVVVGKWLARDSRVIIFDEPTRGIDVGAKLEIYNIMNRLKQEGIGVLFVSSEMPEIMGISDRIIVMCDGRLTGELSSEEASQESVLELATRFDEKSPEAL